MDDERYHLTLSLNGERGSMPGVCIVLVDEQEQLVLASYPAAPSGLRH